MKYRRGERFQRRALSIAAMILVWSCAWVAAAAAPVIAVKPLLAVGTWHSTGPMVTPRAAQTATLLQNGRVLVAGGNAPLASAELFDPVLFSWTSTGSMQTARFSHTATLLPNGKVLVAGGRTVVRKDGGESAPDLATAELYDPASGTWSPTGSMSVAHTFHTATLLDTGEVLVVGAEFSAAVEIYDPKSERWRVVGDYGGSGVTEQSATLLSDGKVLVAGGCCPDSLNFAGVSLYDPLMGTWTNTAALATPRVSQSATLLPSGDVLVTGGQDSNFNDIADPEIYDHQSGRWAAAAGDSNKGALRAAVLLPSGQLLIVGGANTDAAVLYDSNSKQWSSAGNMRYPRAAHTTTLLVVPPNMVSSQVLVAGGGPAIAELYEFPPSFNDGWRPSISQVTRIIVGERLGVEGSLFRGLSEASNGRGSQNSATNYPLVLLGSGNNQVQRLLLPDPLAGWTDTTFTSAPLGDFPTGNATLRVITNGIPSKLQFVVVLPKGAGK